MLLQLGGRLARTWRRGSRPRTLLRSRRALLWGVGLAALAAALCFVPLFGLLGYESSFVIGMVAAFASADVASLAGRTERASAPMSGRLARTLRRYGEALLASLALLVAPLVLLLANAARVRNCDPLAGLAWYGLLACLDAVCGTAVGVVAALALPSPRGRRARVVAWAVILASLAWGVYRFWAAPPIFAYDPFGGFLSGSFYDEDIPITGVLLLYRLMNLLFVAGALGLVALLVPEVSGEPGGGASSRPAWRRRAGAVAFAAVALAGAIPLFVLRGRLGFAPGSDDIARALGGRRETEHFVIIYAAGSPAAREIDRIARDHEFRYAELAAELGVTPLGPGKRLTSFLFASAEQKRDLMGAADTYIAKPWLKQVYLQYEPAPHTVLKHELAHVFAGAFGDRLFHVSDRWRWLGPLPYPAFNVGLIEGMAVAADWIEPDARLTPHQWSRAMLELGLLPPLDEIFGLGFYGESASISYTVAGSFCRWLWDTRGVERLEQLYRSGGDFRGVYGEDLPALGAAWRAFLATQPVTPADLVVARQRFHEPSAFRKVCTHAIAAARDRAERLLGEGRTDEALTLLDGICREDPGEPEHLLDLVHAADAAGNVGAAQAAATRLLDDPHASTPLVARALLELGDLAWRAGRDGEARDRFLRAAALPIDTPTHRLALAEATAVQSLALSSLLRGFFQGAPDSGGRWHRDDAAAMYFLAQADSLAGSDGLPAYLLGRQLLGRDLPHDAFVYFDRARSLALPDETFVRENLRQLAVAAWRDGRSDAALAALSVLHGDDTPLAERLAADDFARRIRWEAGDPSALRPFP